MSRGDDRRRAEGGLLALALLLCASGADAQSPEITQPEGTALSPRNRPPADTFVPAPESSPRADHVVYGSGGVMLMGVGVGAGAMFGLYLNPDLMLEANGYLGVSAGAFGSAASSKAAGVGVRFYVTDTFVVRGAIGLRHLEVEEPQWLLTLFDTDGFDEIRVQTDLGPDVAIGHRWQWDHFIVGVDWLGVYFPLVSIESEKQIVDPANDEILAREPGDLRGFADVRVLFLHLGVSG